tara:strand:+ start:10311 stop:11528 length:1218 start_codon:yes stop_codon:yes gene_type:complete
MFGVDFLLKVSSFILLPFYLAYMSQDEFGLYSYMFVMVSSTTLFLSLGFHVSQMKLFHSFSKTEEKKSFLFTINTSLLFISAILFFTIYYFNLDYFLINFLVDENINYESYRPFFLGLIFLSIFSLMQYSFFITNQNLTLVKLYNILKLIFVNGVVLYFLASLNTDSVLIRFKYSFIVELIIFLSLSYFFLKNFKIKFKLNHLKKILKIGLPIMLSSLVMIFYGLSDRFFLEKYYDLDLLGQYSLGVTFCSIIPLSMASFHTVFSPIIFKEDNNKKNFVVTNKIARICSLIYLIIGFCLILALYFLIELNLIDNSYFNVIFFMPIMIIGAIFFSLSQLYQLIITNLERTDFSLLFNILSTLICIVCCFLFVPDYAAYGAASSVMLATLTSFLLHFYYIKYKLNML